MRQPKTRDVKLLAGRAAQDVSHGVVRQGFGAVARLFALTAAGSESYGDCEAKKMPRFAGACHGSGAEQAPFYTAICHSAHRGSGIRAAAARAKGTEKGRRRAGIHSKECGRVAATRLVASVRNRGLLARG
jgi:hypothetical protein